MEQLKNKNSFQWKLSINFSIHSLKKNNRNFKVDIFGYKIKCRHSLTDINRRMANVSSITEELLLEGI